MAKPKIVFEHHGRDESVPADKPIKYTYRVTKLVNTIEPRIGSVLKEDAVHNLIAEDFADITITPFPAK